MRGDSGFESKACKILSLPFMTMPSLHCLIIILYWKLN